MSVKVIVTPVRAVGYMLYVRNSVKEFLCVGILATVNIPAQQSVHLVMNVVPLDAIISQKVDVPKNVERNALIVGNLAFGFAIKIVKTSISVRSCVSRNATEVVVTIDAKKYCPVGIVVWVYAVNRVPLCVGDAIKRN